MTDSKLIVNLELREKSVTILQDFPGEASHCNMFSIELSRVFFVFFTQGHFSAFDFSIKVSVKSFQVGILSIT